MEEMPESLQNSLQQVTRVSHIAPSTGVDALATFGDRRASDSAYIYGASASLAPLQKLQLACPPRDHATLVRMRLQTGDSTATGGSDCPSSRGSSPRHSAGGPECLPEASLEDAQAGLPEGPTPRADARVRAVGEPHSQAKVAAVPGGGTPPGDTIATQACLTSAAPPAPQSSSTVTGWYLEWARSHPPLRLPASRLRRDIAEQPGLAAPTTRTDYCSLRISGHALSAKPVAGPGCSMVPPVPGAAVQLPLSPQAHLPDSVAAAQGASKLGETAVPLAVQERTAITDAARQRDQQRRILSNPSHVELNPLAVKPAALSPARPDPCLLADRPALALATITVLLRRLLVADSAAATGAEGVDDGIAAALRLVSSNLGFAHGTSPPESITARTSSQQPRLPLSVARPSFPRRGLGSGRPRALWDATTSIMISPTEGGVQDSPAFLRADAAEAQRQRDLEQQRPWADSGWQRRVGAVETEACDSGAVSIVQRPRGVHFESPGSDLSSRRRPAPPATGLQQLWIRTASPAPPVMSPLLHRECRAAVDPWATAPITGSLAPHAEKLGLSHSTVSQRCSPLVLPLRRRATGEADRPVSATNSAVLAPESHRALAVAPSARAAASAVRLATETTIGDASPIGAAGSSAWGGSSNSPFCARACGVDSAASASLMRDVRGLDALLEQEEQDAAKEAAEGHGIALGSHLELGRASPLFHVQRLEASRRRATAGARAAAAAVAAANAAIEGARRQRAANGSAAW